MRSGLAGGAAGLILLAAPSGAATAHTETASYTGPAGFGGVMRVNGHAQGGQSGAIVVPTRGRETAVYVEAADATGRPVRIELAQDASGNGFVTDLGAFCGRTGRAVRLPYPGQPLQIYVVGGDCAGDLSAPTTGNVVARFR